MVLISAILFYMQTLMGTGATQPTNSGAGSTGIIVTTDQTVVY
ncbi:MAG: hypothetical protein WCH46_09605 [bacterium]